MAKAGGSRSSTARRRLLFRDVTLDAYNWGRKYAPEIVSGVALRCEPGRRGGLLAVALVVCHNTGSAEQMRESTRFANPIAADGDDESDPRILN